MNTRTIRSTVLAGPWLVLSACSADVPDSIGPQVSEEPICSISNSLFVGGPGKDGIPALTNPTLVNADGPGTEYLSDDDRVIGVDVSGMKVAIPLNIMWWHEIVNVDSDGIHLAVTHCPLTGSSLVFDRGPHAGVEFGVSGLLHLNNLVMYDRSDGESLWPQMERTALCGPGTGQQLDMVPSMEMTWGAWRDLNPEGLVVSSETGHFRDYRFNPYGNYGAPDNPELLIPLPGGIDPRFRPKERVLGFPWADGGMAFPFATLSREGSVAVVESVSQGRPVVIFWDAAADAAVAFEAHLDGELMEFRVEGSRIVDERTGSLWRLDGYADGGPLQSKRLQPLEEAHVAYWFAWAAFHPETLLWSGA